MKERIKILLLEDYVVCITPDVEGRGRNTTFAIVSTEHGHDEVLEELHSYHHTFIDGTTLRWVKHTEEKATLELGLKNRLIKVAKYLGSDSACMGKKEVVRDIDLPLAVFGRDMYGELMAHPCYTKSDSGTYCRYCGLHSIYDEHKDEKELR